MGNSREQCRAVPNANCGPDEQIRVAWLPPSLARGFYWQPVFKEFTKSFPNTVVFTSCWPGFVPGYEKTFNIRVLPRLKFVTLKRNPEGYDHGFNWPSISLIAELLRFRPQVLLTGGFHLWTLYGLLFKAFTRCRMILVCDGISPGIACLRSPIRLASRRIMARFIDASICNTREAFDYLKDVLRVPECKLIHYPYEIGDVSILSSGNEDQTNFFSSIRRPAFLFIGTIIRRKGWHALLEATSLLIKRGLNSFSVVFAGEGDESDELRRRTNLLGLQEFVHAVGAVQYENLGSYLRECDVFVLPTLEDIWAVVVSEAMAFGKPVLCSKNAGARELVQHGFNGFIFDPHNPEELADYMAHFIQRPQLAREFGAHSHKIVARYTPEHTASIMGGLVRNVLSLTRDGEEHGIKAGAAQ